MKCHWRIVLTVETKQFVLNCEILLKTCNHEKNNLYHTFHFSINQVYLEFFFSFDKPCISILTLNKQLTINKLTNY